MIWAAPAFCFGVVFNFVNFVFCDRHTPSANCTSRAVLSISSLPFSFRAMGIHSNVPSRRHESFCLVVSTAPAVCYSIWPQKLSRSIAGSRETMFPYLFPLHYSKPFTSDTPLLIGSLPLAILLSCYLAILLSLVLSAESKYAVIKVVLQSCIMSLSPIYIILSSFFFFFCRSV